MSRTHDSVIGEYKRIEELALRYIESSKSEEDSYAQTPQQQLGLYARTVTKLIGMEDNIAKTKLAVLWVAKLRMEGDSVRAIVDLVDTSLSVGADRKYEEALANIVDVILFDVYMNNNQDRLPKYTIESTGDIISPELLIAHTGLAFKLRTATPYYRQLVEDGNHEEKNRMLNYILTKPRSVFMEYINTFKPDYQDVNNDPIQASVEFLDNGLVGVRITMTDSEYRMFSQRNKDVIKFER